MWIERWRVQGYVPTLIRVTGPCGNEVYAGVIETPRRGNKIDYPSVQRMTDRLEQPDQSPIQKKRNKKPGITAPLPPQLSAHRTGFVSESGYSIDMIRDISSVPAIPAYHRPSRRRLGRGFRTRSTDHFLRSRSSRSQTCASVPPSPEKKEQKKRKWLRGREGKRY
jgi:hypothetical protein